MRLEKIRENVSIEPRWVTTSCGLDQRYILRDGITSWHLWANDHESAVAMGLRYIKKPTVSLLIEYIENRHFISLSSDEVIAIYESFKRYGFIETNYPVGIEAIQNQERLRVYQEMQLGKLNDIVNWTYTNCDYYSSVLEEFKKNNTGEIESFSKLQDLPILPKSTFRSEITRLNPRTLSDNRESFPTSWATSSGTSGNRVQTLTDPNRQKRFVSDCTWQFISSDFPEKTMVKSCVITTPVCSGTECHMDINKPIEERLISDGRRLILNSFNSPSVVSSAHIQSILDEINEYSPNVLRGAASYIAPIAEFIDINNLPVPKFDYIILGWELNSRIHIRLLERVFGCPVIDEWGATEMMPIASLCKHGNYHIADEHYVEVIRNGKAVEQNEIGKVLVTSLKRHATPLIRYDIGDLARPSYEPCSCGNPSPILTSIEGRARDVISDIDGNPITARQVDNVVSGEKSRGGIRYYSLIQKSINEYEFRFVPSKVTPNNFLESLENDLVSMLGPESSITINKVKEIYPSNSGKFRLAYSEFKENDYEW